MCVKCEVNGKPNAEYLDSIGTCAFGCGNVVSSDGDDDGVGAGICPTCRDHSANVSCCEECGAEYEDWGGIWEQTIGERTIPTEFVV